MALTEVIGDSGPTSLNEYLDLTGQPDSAQAMREFSAVLGNYRAETAKTLGITEDQLHMMGDEAIQAAFAALQPTPEQ